jgi:hypothetical protein
VEADRDEEERKGMAEETRGTNGRDGTVPSDGLPERARLAAHERLSTGALARWARACATHPWRVLGAWLAIVVVLVGIVSAFGGSLRTSSRSPGRTRRRRRT